MTRLETSKHVVDTVRSLAKESFKDFELRGPTTRPGYPSASWCCRAERHRFHAFNIYFAPGTVVVWGDIGDFIIRHQDGDSLEWLLRCTKSDDYPDYLLGKVAASPSARKDFYVGDVYAWLDEEADNIRRLHSELASEVDADDVANVANVAESREESLGLLTALRARFVDLLQEQLNNEEVCWALAWSEHRPSSEVPSCHGWSSEMLWLWHAVVLFTQLYRDTIKTQDGAA